MDLTTTYGNIPSLEIDVKFSRIQYGLCGFVCRQRGCATERCAHASKQFVNAEGLGDIVVSLNVQRLNFDLFVTPS